jgi:hypothetical protein
MNNNWFLKKKLSMELRATLTGLPISTRTGVTCAVAVRDDGNVPQVRRTESNKQFSLENLVKNILKTDRQTDRWE